MATIGQISVRDELNTLLDEVAARLLQRALAETVEELPEFELPDLWQETRLLNVCQAFELNEFEIKVLAVCLAMELRSEDMLIACAAAMQVESHYSTFLTPSMLRRWLSPGELSDDLHAFQASGKLLRWNLIELGESVNSSLVEALRPVRIAVGALLFIKGDDQPAPELTAFTSLAEQTTTLSESQLELVEQAGKLNKKGTQDFGFQLYGTNDRALEAVAIQILRQAGKPMLHLDIAGMLGQGNASDSLLRSVGRDVLLKDYQLLLSATGDFAEGQQPEGYIASLLNLVSAPAIVISSEPLNILNSRALVPLEVRPPTPQEQREQWAASLNISGGHNLLEQLGDQFSLSLDRIDTMAREVRVTLPKNATPEQRLEAAWERARVANRSLIGTLADRIASKTTWNDLILPESDLGVLQQISMHVRHRSVVYEQLGMARPGRGRALTALFSGPSGTGKTLSAEVLANDLQLDLYRIDLSNTVSKYIGETEKNLKRIFDAADQGGCILLFDEADSVFGKRGEVKDSNDRYANIQVNYLLQRLESYNGLAILTTNMESSMDIAFMRRIQFVLNFRPPAPADRERLWRLSFPAALDTTDINFAQLAQADVAGGNIRSIAMNAVFTAVASGQGLTNEIVNHALQLEYKKLGRLVLPS